MESRVKTAALFATICLVSLPSLSWQKVATTTQRKNQTIANQQGNNCDKLLLDRCATTLFVFGRRDVYLPQNFDEMVPHCREEFDAEDCIKSFARKCLGPFERQVAGMLILGAGQVLRKRCSQEGTREYLTHYKCIKRTLPQMHDAMDQLIYTLMDLSAGINHDENNNNKNVTTTTTTKLDDELKVPTSCCAFARFQQLANQIVRTGCADFDPKAEHYIGTKMIKGYVGDVLELSCQGYEQLSGDKCARITLPSGGFEWRNNTLTKLVNYRHAPAPKPNSVVVPFLNIFTNL